MSQYSIKDLENLTGIKAHTIRMWEQRYGIPKPNRTDSNIRFYGDQELKTMLNIALLNSHGYKISKIACMSSQEMCQKVLETITKEQKFEDQICALTVAMLDLDEGQFEKIMTANVLHSGFESTMINVVYPFLNRVGTLWTANSVNPAHEHFITNLIRQKLIVAIDGQFPPCGHHPKKFMLFLPEGELHEISLLFSYYLIKSRGHKVIYLGQSLSLHDLGVVYNAYHPDYLVSMITSSPGSDHIQEYVDILGENFGNTQILLSGIQVIAQEIALKSSNIQILTHVNQLLELLEEEQKGKNKY